MSGTTDDIRRTAALLAELIAFPTHQAGADGKAGNERALCDHVAPKLAALGADDVIVADTPRTDGSPGAYVFARWGTPTRVINAHVDTVPANTGWSRDPWQPLIDDTRVWGLGACDTKAAIAATLVALAGAPARPRDFGVLFSGDEEHGGAVLQAFLASPHARPIREVIVCEPTARTAGFAHRGVLRRIARCSSGPAATRRRPIIYPSRSRCSRASPPRSTISAARACTTAPPA